MQDKLDLSKMTGDEINYLLASGRVDPADAQEWAGTWNAYPYRTARWRLVTKREYSCHARTVLLVARLVFEPLE